MENETNKENNKNQSPEDKALAKISKARFEEHQKKVDEQVKKAVAAQEVFNNEVAALKKLLSDVDNLDSDIKGFSKIIKSK